jgi:hypothetical protein
MKKFSLYWSYTKLGFYALVPVVLLILPADFFDNGQTVCLSVLLFNFECYACGMSSAVMHLIHAEFEMAFAYNMGSFVVFPFLCILWGKWFWEEYKANQKLKQVPPFLS